MEGSSSDSGSGSSRNARAHYHDGSSNNNRSHHMNHGPQQSFPGGGKSSVRPSDFPLRILVLSEMVGAIIGRSGGTIRQITQESRARVDVHRKENAGSLEKVITIYGNPENCSKACSKIMEVMQQEALNTNRAEIPLKILAHNNLIGRIIGKSGNTIKKIMEDTNTKITVSTNIHDVNSFNLERIITIKGNLEDICKAENMISTKLKQCYESDLAAMAPQTLMFPGLHPMAMMSTISSHPYPPNRPGGANASASGGTGTGMATNSSFPSGMYGGPLPPLIQSYGSGPPPIPMNQPAHMASMQQDQTKETVYLYIPNSAVGAIIGTGGSTIRDMISSSGASIKVAQPSKDDNEVGQGNSSLHPVHSPPASAQQSPSSIPPHGLHLPLEKAAERKVTIIGTPDAQWKAQFMIFRKVGYEGLSGPQEAVLKVEILVPSTQVGRIIGKGGSTVRELQRLTHAIIKLPEEGISGDKEETSVHIIGDFLSTQAAQRQIRALVNRGLFPGGQRGSSRPNKNVNHQQTSVNDQEVPINPGSNAHYQSSPKPE